MTTVLEVAGVTKQFGGLTAVSDVSFSIEEGEIFGLIGPNGAGKTTLFNLITAIYPVSSGQITFLGREIVATKRLALLFTPGVKPHQVTRMGIGRTFQNIRLFQNMTSLENVVVGTDAHHRQGVLSAIFRTPRMRREEREGHQEAEDALHFVGIHRFANEVSASLSYGDQHRVEIARAIATRPKLLLLDEPAAGMNPTEKAQLMQLIGRIRDLGITILIIEHDMKVVMGISNRVAVLDYGQKIAEGPPQEIQRDPRVIEAYLGRQAAGEAG